MDVRQYASGNSAGALSEDADAPRQITTTPSRTERSRPLVHILSGAGAGGIASIVMCPLDVVKTRLQTADPRYHGMRGTIRSIVQEEGARSLYRGLTPTLLGLLPNWAIYFVAYDEIKHHLCSSYDISDQNPLLHCVSAMSAGALCSIATNPLWVIKTRIMLNPIGPKGGYPSISSAFLRILREEGFRGFYKGVTPSLLGVVHVGIQIPLYERLKFIIQSGKDDPTMSLGAVDIIIASSLSKAFASVCWYPHEILRTRLQNQTSIPPKYRGVVHCAMVVAREEGMRAFYRGMGTNLLRVTPSGAITFTAYEMIARALTHWENSLDVAL
eukprot:Opistho-2@51975